jgi:two-component system sensor kinase
MEELSGHPLSESRGKNWIRSFVPEQHQTRMCRMFDHMLQHGEARGYSCPLLARNGDFREIEWHTKTILDDAGTPIGLVSTGHDVTERRVAQRLAAERSRLADIGAVTAQVAHDIGNPVSAISMQVQLISRYLKRGEPVEKLEKPVERLVAELRRLEGLVREFLDFAREQRLEMSDVEVPELLQMVAENWQPIATSQRIAVAVKCDDPSLSIHADRGKLHRVLDNLVKNALEAIGDGPGSVHLTASAPDSDRIRISVEDDGPGISDKVQLFRLFETTKENGSGLGLAVSRQIIAAHGGELRFASRTPRGATFLVDLPRQQPSA